MFVLHTTLWLQHVPYLFGVFICKIHGLCVCLCMYVSVHVCMCNNLTD